MMLLVLFSVLGLLAFLISREIVTSNAMRADGVFEVVEYSGKFLVRKIVGSHIMYVKRWLFEIRNQPNIAPDDIYTYGLSDANPYHSLEEAQTVAELLTSRKKTSMKVVWQEQTKPLSKSEKDLIPELMKAVDSGDKEKEILILKQLNIEH